MRVQVEATLDWLEENLAAREAAGQCNGFIAGPDAAPSYTVGDLQLYCTLEFFSNPKVNKGKLTPKWCPKEDIILGGNERGGGEDRKPWLGAWFRRMHRIAAELQGPGRR